MRGLRKEKWLAASSIGSQTQSMNMPAQCPDCGAEVSPDATSCSNCNPSPATRDPQERAAAVACYLTPFPAILLLFLKHFRESSFVRFHAYQSIIVAVAVLVLLLPGALLASLGWTVAWLMFGVLFLVALFFLWMVLSIKAAQGMRFELPFVGPFASRRSAL